jgi:mannobiose 2-epimerase
MPDSLAASIRETLRRHVVDVWFPRCVDRERGGYDCDFDRRWRKRGPQHRMLEFQARQMRSAARLALCFPSEGRFHEFALHGLRYLRDVMWDLRHGGWYTLVSADGSPLSGGTKHAHGTAYAVQGCAVVFQATGDPDARALSEEAFEWFDAHAHDDDHGGYRSWLTREGGVIRSVQEVPAGTAPVDHVAEAVGLRDVNVHGDWLEGLNESASILNHRRMAERLEEIADLFLDHVTTPYGDLYYGFRDDWTPLPQPERFGHAFQTMERLISAAPSLRQEERIRERAFLVGEHALRHAARDGGGYVFFRAIHAPERLEGARLAGLRRVWWVQLAALNALALLATAPRPDRERFEESLARHWRFVRENLIDSTYAGFHPVVPRDLGRRRRLRRRIDERKLAKGTAWKDASHEVDSLLGTLKVLSPAPVARPATVSS